MAWNVQGYSTCNTYAVMQESQENQSTDLSTFNCLRDPDSIKSGKNELKCKAGWLSHPMLMSSITDQSKGWTSINLEWVTVWSQHISPATAHSPPCVLWQSFILMDDSDWLNCHCHNPWIQLSLFRPMLRDIHMIWSSLHVRSYKSLIWDHFCIDNFLGLASNCPGDKNRYISLFSILNFCKSIVY